jgi:hypothetical protein
LLKSVRCEIISFTRNEQIDAYVLRWVLSNNINGIPFIFGNKAYRWEMRENASERTQRSINRDGCAWHFWVLRMLHENYF